MISYSYGLFMIADAASATAFKASIYDVSQFVKLILKILHDNTTTYYGTFVDKEYTIVYCEFGCRMLTIVMEGVDYIIPVTDKYIASLEKLNQILFSREGDKKYA